MVDTEQGQVYENQIEDLFYEYCENNDIDTSKRKIDDNDARCIWKYIYNILYKPDRDTIRYNNKRSKIDYSDIEGIYNILNVYEDLCFKFKILPMIEDFCTLTGISRDTLNSWSRGEYRGSEGNATYKHSDIAQKIKDMTQLMGIKDQHGTDLGRQSLANNWDGMGLNFAQKQAFATAAAYSLPQASREEIAARYQAYKELPEKPDFDS